MVAFFSNSNDYFAGSIVNCGVRGEINRSGTNLTNYAGGIVGRIYGYDESVNISFSYSNVNGNYGIVGGIAQVAEKRSGDLSITNCYYSDNQSGSFSPFPPPAWVFLNLVESLSESEMKKVKSYVDWDFEFSWIQDDRINDGLLIPVTVLELMD